MTPLALTIAIVFVGVAAASALAHAAQPHAARVPSAGVDRTARRYGVLLAAIEFGALAALLAALFRVGPGTERWLVGVAIVCVAAMIGVWALWLRPLATTIAAWEPETAPADRAAHHGRWVALHRARIVLAVIALAVLLTGALALPAR